MRSAKLGDLATVLRRGITPKYVESLTPESITILNQKCINYGKVNLEHAKVTSRISSLKSDRFLRRGDILVCSTGRGTLGRTAIWAGGVEATVDSHVTIIRISDSLSSEYIAMAVGEREAEIVALGAGSTNMTELSPASLSGILIPLPPLEEQQRIVDLIGALDEAIEAADRRMTSASGFYQELITTYFIQTIAEVELGSVIKRTNDSVTVSPDVNYRIAGLERSGLGFIDRGILEGRKIGYSRLTRIGINQLVYRKLTAWEGPISVSGEAEDGAFVSSEFPTFSVDQSLLRPGLLRHLCTSPILWGRMAQRIQGSVLRRKRLNPEQLLQVSIPIAPLCEQDTLLELLDALAESATSAEDYASSLRNLRSELLTVLLSGEHEIPESYDAVTVSQLEPAA